MQLPRGTFRSIKKGVKFCEILSDLVSSRFTGVCTLSSATLNGDLIFRGGTCVLAEIQNQNGDKGWAAVLEQSDLVTDLAISDFNTAQIQLALDFNKKAIVRLPTPQPGERPVPASSSSPSTPAGDRSSPEPGKQMAHARREQKKKEAKKSSVPAEGIPSGASKGHRIAPEEPTESVKPDTTGEKLTNEVPDSMTEKTSGQQDSCDLDMFDSVDLDDVALKIRKDCKIILKQLQLDHLTEK